MMMQLDPTSHGSTVLREFDDVADPFVGSSPRICAVRALMAKLASNDSTILITGESGTGKELAARIIHETSACRHRPFVPVNCGAIPDEVLEREIFGQVRDALIGTTIPGQGRCYLANGGTILLDEIDALSPKLQVKLLRTLQERRFEPVGSDHSIQQVVRVIAATNNDLQLAVRKDKFCADLFCWLSVRTLHLPPLRERDGDIPLLIRYFSELHARRNAKKTIQIDRSAMAALERYNWPGNVRELENLMEALVVLNDNGVIQVDDLPEHIFKTSISRHHDETEVTLPDDGVNLDAVLEEIENDLILQALQRTGGNKTEAAKLLKLNRTTFLERLRRKGLLQSARDTRSRFKSSRKKQKRASPRTTFVLTTGNRPRLKARRAAR